MVLDLETLDLARIHEQALITLVLPGYSASARDAMVRRAGKFFAEAITPIEKTHRTAREANIRTSGRIERLDTVTRTVLYRVAQEALTNAGRHARASRVDVSIQKLPRAVGLTIQDNGKSFQVERVLHAKRNKRLGLLGMRERVEMVGGSLRVESTPGQGTTIRAEIPFTHDNGV